MMRAASDIPASRTIAVRLVANAWLAVTGLKQDVAILKQDVATLKEDMTEVKGTLAEILRRLPEPPSPN